MRQLLGSGQARRRASATRVPGPAQTTRRTPATRLLGPAQTTRRTPATTLLGSLAIAAAAALFAVGSAIVPPAQADHATLHACGAQPAPARFPAGFPMLVDSECEYRIGGFGGPLPDDAAWGVTPSAHPFDNAPVIFVHGNVVDHADWYPVRDQLIADGWDPDDLWALAYNGLGNDSGSAGATPNPRRDAEHRAAGGDGMARNTSNEVNVADVTAFIDAVLAHTGETRFSMVGHSLGVTVARRALESRPDLAARLVAFVGIAGGNHGTSLCPPGSGVRLDDEGGHPLNGCDELEAGSAWLAALNATPADGGFDELASAAVLTVYDGTGAADVAYVGPTYAQSPRLDDITPAAVDCAYPGRGHNDLRLSAGIVDGYTLFLQAADDGAPLTTCPPDPLGLR